MANRAIQVKVLKSRNRNKQRRHSRIAVNMGQPFEERILNRQIINAVRDIAQDIRATMDFFMSDKMVEVTTPILKQSDLSMRTCIFNGRTIKTYLFFDIGLKKIFIIEFNLRLDIVRKSCNFNTLAQAQDVYASGNTPWM